MPFSFQSIIDILPTNIWKYLKKLVSTEKTYVFDLPFMLSTKYTPALLIVLTCLSFANQFIRNIEIDCSIADWEVSGKVGAYDNGRDNSRDNNVNDFCWNHETFLVVKSFQPHLRRSIPYPGVSSYNREIDELVKQHYYKYVWMCFLILAVIAFFPFFFWKIQGIKKVKPLVDIIDAEDCSEEDQRLDYFLETVSFNDYFGWIYLGFKILAILLPLLQWYLLCGFLGHRFRYYGIDVLQYILDTSDPWPNPMDIMFPKVAKCEMSRYGPGGDIELRSILCHLPMNHITQWSFFIFWIWMVLLFVINILSIFYLLLHVSPFYRRYKYVTFVKRLCLENVEQLSQYKTPTGRMCEKEKVISINMRFGDWVVLSFIEYNLEDWKFREFIKKLATTENNFIQLTQITHTLNANDKVHEPITNVGILNETNEMETEHYKIDVTEIGFKQSIVNPTFTESHLPSVASDEQLIKISPLVKVDRKMLTKTSEKKVNSNNESDVTWNPQNCDVSENNWECV